MILVKSFIHEQHILDYDLERCNPLQLLPQNSHMVILGSTSVF